MVIVVPAALADCALTPNPVAAKASAIAPANRDFLRIYPPELVVV
jgi:hypothetical protein